VTPDYIVPGAFVKLRDGSKARIYATDGPAPYHVHGAIRENGNWLHREWRGSQYTPESCHHRDIVGPWIEKPDASKLWPILPPWIEWLAMDEDGGWYGYQLEPELQKKSWGARLNTSFVYIPTLFAPAIAADWRQSLIRRPKS